MKYSGAYTGSLESTLELLERQLHTDGNATIQTLGPHDQKWVMACEQCIRESRADDSLTRPTLQKPNERITAPEDAMQVDLIPDLLPMAMRI